MSNDEELRSFFAAMAMHARILKQKLPETAEEAESEFEDICAEAWAFANTMMVERARSMPTRGNA